MGQKLNGPLIKALRKSTGQRQDDLAVLAGISVRSIGDAERGKAVGIDVCIRIAKALLVDPADQLLAEKGLRLDQVRRSCEPATAYDAARRSVAEIGRVRFTHQGRRAIRLFLLRQVTPPSGFTLQAKEVTLFDDSMEKWPKGTFEGFAAACLPYGEALLAAGRNRRRRKGRR
jgi:transcriptional regulator with XRE-family HTH domain